MCFTININATREAIEKRYRVDASRLDDFEYRYFYKAFDQPLVPVVTGKIPGQVQLFKWGLIPSWIKTEDQAKKIINGTFNARGETMHQKPAFRDSFKNHRCLVIVAGFYEWQHSNGRKIPWYITHSEDLLMSLAGLHSSWTNPETGEIIKSLTIITTKANPLMEKIHNTKKRMPVILSGINETLWLDKKISAGNTDKFLKPYDQGKLKAYTIAGKISSQSADPFDPSIIDPVDYFTEQKLF